MMIFLMILFFMIFNNLTYEILSFILSLLFFKMLMSFQNMTFMFMKFNSFYFLDLFNSVLMIFTVFMLIISFLASNLIVKFNYKSYNLVMMVMLIILMMMFSCSSFLSFYIYFEFSILPIFMIIMGWGYQTERVSSSLALMFYTVSASMPLLICVVMTKSLENINFMTQFFFKINLNSSNYLFVLSFILAFLIKLPIFLGHLWLPKAHVEAPVVGSMILASILLKLGGYGLIRFSSLIFSSSFISLIISISLSGSAIIGFICIKQLDMKVIIAYSSVAHMGLVISSILYFSTMSVIGSLMLMIAHGLSSSSMFFGGNLLYLRSFSRSMILSKGFLGSSPLLSFFWLFSMMSSMAAPPLINLLSEIICITSIMSFSIFNFIWVILSVFMGGAYSILLYSSTQQSSKFSNLMNVKFSLLNEGLIMFSHMFWILFLILSSSLFISF